jgi:hypothetical protein
MGGWQLDTFRIIVVGGDLEDIPDPACVQAKLRQYDQPTREQIAAAFEACLKPKG